MKCFLFGFLAVLFLILNTIPYLHIMADDMPTNSQYEMLGAYALSTLITSGEATELDFSDYTENDTSFLIDLGEAIFTGDWSGLAEDGLEWLGETADNIYDSYKEYISQWKSDHLGIMYSNWFPDETIYVGPDDSYSLAKPLRELLTPRDTNEPVVPPQPDNIQILLDFINKRDNTVANSFFFYDYPGSYGTSINDDKLVQVPCTNYSWCAVRSLSGIPSTFVGNTKDTPFMYPTDIRNLYISFDSNNIYHFSDTVNSQYNVVTYWGSSPSTCPYGRYSTQYNGIVGIGWGDRPSFNRSSSGTLEEVLNYIKDYYKNVNIYVNNSPISLVGFSGPTYPIVIPGQLTIWNNQPLEYSFPADTHIELPDLTNIIRNAINSSGVVMWSDIADTYVDINGQTAIAVTKIVRNDYDNLYMEQYPYPAMLIGMTDQTKFNEHLLDESHAYLSPMGTVVQETVNVLPSELVGVLAIGAILTIFAVIINRLLE